MIGTGYPQQEVAGETHPDHGNIQAPRQLKRDQPQRQRLSTFTLQDLVQQGSSGAQRGKFILGKPQVIHAPQQRLAQFIGRQHWHAQADLLLQQCQLSQDHQRLHCRVVLGSNPQRCFKQRRGGAFQAGEKSCAGIHCILRQMPPF